MELISIGDVLSSPDNNPEWFCLPSDRGSWTLDTKGVFTLDSRDFDPESNDYLPEQVKNEGWIEVLDGGAIEEIVDNAKIQLESPSLNDLFRAFVFYYENDAFITF
ncbi:conserved hypothetical protein [Vibrio rotiferianus]|uniref:DUF7716 domain-containing protein n=1 Tax=Vibrio rotiferianus TaxID=190895 RepID=UPI002895232C|nr:conserved hypothetical protein [Vibrio rotiferianus]